MTHKAVTLMACGKPASPPFYSPWKTSEVSHRLTASTTTKLCLTPYRGTDGTDASRKMWAPRETRSYTW